MESSNVSFVGDPIPQCTGVSVSTINNSIVWHTGLAFKHEPSVGYDIAILAYGGLLFFIDHSTPSWSWIRFCAIITRQQERSAQKNHVRVPQHLYGNMEYCRSTLFKRKRSDRALRGFGHWQVVGANGNTRVQMEDRIFAEIWWNRAVYT